MAEENVAELPMPCGFDDDLAAQVTQVRNRLRGFLTQIHPSLERVLSPRLGHTAVITLLTRYPSPARLRTAGRGHVRALLKKHARRLTERLTEEIFTALAAQTVTVTGTTAAEKIIGRLALLGAQRTEIEAEILTVVDARRLTQVLTSMPGVGVRTAARILTEVVGKNPKDAAHLASSSDIAPVTRRSGSSIRGESPSRRGNKTLIRAPLLSAFASINVGPASRAYYGRKRAQGKGHNQAIIALARRRTDVLYTMLRDGTLYTESAPSAVALAA